MAAPCAQILLVPTELGEAGGRHRTQTGLQLGGATAAVAGSHHRHGVKVTTLAFLTATAAAVASHHRLGAKGTTLALLTAAAHRKPASGRGVRFHRDTVGRGTVPTEAACGDPAKCTARRVPTAVRPQDGQRSTLAAPPPRLVAAAAAAQHHRRRLAQARVVVRQRQMSRY